MFAFFKIITAIIFIVTGGAVFTEKYRKYKTLVLFASIISIIGAFYLIKSIERDVVGEVINGKIDTESSTKCEQSYLLITKDNSHCGFKLNKQLGFEYKNQIISESITVIIENSGSSEEKKIPANMVILYPQSRTQRFAFIQACQNKENEEDYGLCWASYIFDKKRKKIISAFTGKYGPERWIKWSSDDKYAILSSSNEGVKFLHAINTINHCCLIVLPTMKVAEKSICYKLCQEV